MKTIYENCESCIHSDVHSGSWEPDDPPCIDCKKGHFDFVFPGAYWGLDFCVDYDSGQKLLPSPRFPIMSQQDIAKSQKILEAAEVMSLAAIKFRKAKEELSGWKFDVVFYARLFNHIRQDYT